MVGWLSRRSTPARRRLALAVFGVAVCVVHGFVLTEISERMADLRASADMPRRIEVAYVRELELAPAPPPMAAPPPAPPPAPRRAAAPRPAASAPAGRRGAQPRPAEVVLPEPAAVEASAPPIEPATEEDTVVAAAPLAFDAASGEAVSAPLDAASAAAAPSAADEAASAPAPAVSSPEAAAVAAASPAAAASSPMPFEWPGSTRLTYTLVGNVRGEVHGSAQVEWIRVGMRYQVHLDVVVGLPIAPLMSRRMSSDGTLGPDGLTPIRYDEDTKVAFRDRRRVVMRFAPDAVVLADGRRLPRPPGVQDTASQFVQLAWLFTTRPELLRTGSQVAVPLALPRSMDTWVYDVLDEETLYLPFGHAQAFHLKPRRVSRPGGELIAEIWFSPQLRYLPARIRIQQDEQTFIDLKLARKPELAGP